VTRRWVWALLAGTVLGLVLGFGLSLWLLAPLPEPKSAPILEAFDLQVMAAKSGPAPWKILKDGPAAQEGAWYYLGPWKGQSSSLSRQVVAEAKLPTGQRGEFVNNLARAIDEAIEAQGARTGAGWTSGSSEGNGVSDLQWKAQHYGRGGMRGIVHILLMGEGERATLVVTFSEVRATAESWPVGDIPLFRGRAG
jgi:hypothetical protein